MAINFYFHVLIANFTHLLSSLISSILIIPQVKKAFFTSIMLSSQSLCDGMTREQGEFVSTFLGHYLSVS